MRFQLVTLVLAAAGAAHGGSERLAAEITKEYESATVRWAERLQQATDAEQQMQIWAERPDASEYAGRVWEELRDSLRDEWTLEYAAWLLENAPVFAAEREVGGEGRPAQRIRHAVDRFHVESPRVGRLCLSLTSVPDPETLELVRKVAENNPDPAVQGQAEMAIAMLLKGLGEDREVMEERLTHLREAIKKAAGVKVGDVTVGELAEDELFVIMHLSKGRTAPDIIGRDVSGEAFALSRLEAKVIVVAFWHSNMRDAERGIAMLRKLHGENKDRGMELIGVTTDKEEVLRRLKGNGTIPWRDFADKTGRITSEYRVRNLPMVYVMDRSRTIHYVGGPGSFVDFTVLALLGE